MKAVAHTPGLARWPYGVAFTSELLRVILWERDWPRVGACRASSRAEVREAIHAAAFGLCAAATSNHLPSGPEALQFRDAYTLGYHAGGKPCGSPRASAGCSVQDLFGRSRLRGLGQTPQVRGSLAVRFHLLDRESLRSRRLAASSCADASTRD